MTYVGTDLVRRITLTLCLPHASPYSLFKSYSLLCCCYCCCCPRKGTSKAARQGSSSSNDYNKQLPPEYRSLTKKKTLLAPAARLNLSTMFSALLLPPLVLVLNVSLAAFVNARQDIICLSARI